MKFDELRERIVKLPWRLSEPKIVKCEHAEADKLRYVIDQDNGKKWGGEIICGLDFGYHESEQQHLHAVYLHLCANLMPRMVEALHIDKLCPVIENALKSYRCTYHIDQDQNGLDLPDVLSAPNDGTIKTGLEEIVLIAEIVADAIMQDARALLAELQKGTADESK